MTKADIAERIADTIHVTRKDGHEILILEQMDYIENIQPKKSTPLSHFPSPSPSENLSRLVGRAGGEV